MVELSYDPKKTYKFDEIDPLTTAEKFMIQLNDFLTTKRSLRKF